MMPRGNWTSVAVVTLILVQVLHVCGKRKQEDLPQKVDNFTGCKYFKKGHVGVCNLSSNTQEKTLVLRKGGNHCPKNKTVTQPCNTLKCKYKFAGWGSCNRADNTRVRLFKLREGQPETCPWEKRKFRQCKSGKRKKLGCRYKKGHWSTCDMLTQVKTRSLTLKKGGASECQQVKTIIKKCIRSGASKSSLKGHGLPIAESPSNVPSESVFNLKLPDPPEQPQIRSTDITDTTIRLTWKPRPHEDQGEILGYIIEYFSISGKENVWVTASSSVADNSYSVEQLQPSTSYMFQVRTKNVIGVSRASTPSETVRTLGQVYSAPSRPKSLRLIPNSNSVLVTWVPPPKDDLVEGYVLSYGKGLPDIYKTHIDRHMYTYNIQSLEPNTEYVIKLNAYNKMGEGQSIYDAVKTLKEWSHNRVLLPPVGIHSSAQSKSSIVVTWSDANQEDGIQFPDNYLYMVRYRLLLDKYSYINTTENSVQVHDLEPFLDYEVSVRIIAGRDVSQWSMSTLVRTHQAAPTTAPTDLTVLNDKPGSIAVNWQPPVKANGVISGYTVLYTVDRTQSDTDWQAIQVDGEELSTRITRVEPEQTYYFKVQARNRKGYGPMSNIVAFSTSAAAPGTGPSDLTVALSPGSQAETVLLSWQPPSEPNGIITGYLIYYTTDYTQQDRSWVLEGVLRDTLSTKITDLTPCTKYFFKVQARNKAGFGPLSSTSMIQTSGSGEVKCSPDTDLDVPLLPSVGLKTHGVTHNSMILSWKDLGRSDKFTQTSIVYIVRYKSMKPSATYQNKTTHDQNVLLTGLEPNMIYELSVSTDRNGVQGPWSMTTSVRTKEDVPGGPPEDVTVTAMSDHDPTTIIVAWQPPAKPNGLITGYLVLYTAMKDAQTEDWVTETVTGDSLSTVLKDLTSNTQYYIQVQARTKKGVGTMSDVVRYSVQAQTVFRSKIHAKTVPAQKQHFVKL